MNDQPQPERRHYPAACLSWNCARSGDDCTGCRHLPNRLAFEHWVKETNARQVDKIWTPTIYEATSPARPEGATS